MAAPKKPVVPEGDFVLEHQESKDACERCFGLTTLAVRASDGVIGHVVAAWPWNTDISSDPAEHPAEPHYAVEWFGQDIEHNDLPGMPDASAYFVGRAIFDRHVAERVAPSLT